MNWELFFCLIAVVIISQLGKKYAFFRQPNWSGKRILDIFLFIITIFAILGLGTLILIGYFSSK